MDINNSSSSDPVFPSQQTPAYERHGVSFREALLVWVRVAALSFGGPAGQIAVMHRILVEEKTGSVKPVFCTPSTIALLFLAGSTQAGRLYRLVTASYPGRACCRDIIYSAWSAGPGNTELDLCQLWSDWHCSGAFFGLKAAVLAVVLEAVMRVGRRALKSQAMVGVAVLSFIAIFVFAIPFPFIIAAAALIGFIGSKTGISAFQPRSGSGESDAVDDSGAAIDVAFAQEIPEHVRPSHREPLK
jgi:chromate transporter